VELYIGRGKPKNSDAILSTTNPTWIDTGANPGLRGERPETNDLNHSMATNLTLHFDIKIKCNLFLRIYSIFEPPLHTLKPKHVEIIFTNSVRTSKKPQHVKKIICLVLFKEITPVRSLRNFPGKTRPGRDTDHTLPSKTEVKESEIYSSQPMAPAWW
jgi:hypothetical protein